MLNKLDPQLARDWDQQHHPRLDPCVFHIDSGSGLGRWSQNHLVVRDAGGERETYNSEVDWHI